MFFSKKILQIVLSETAWNKMSENLIARIPICLKIIQIISQLHLENSERNFVTGVFWLV